MGNTNNDETNSHNRSTSTNTSEDKEITPNETSKLKTSSSNNETVENSKIESLSTSLESSEEDSDSSSVYEIEKIVSHQYNKKLKQMEYLIKWKGYSENENTWENEQNLTDVVIEEYKKRLEENGPKTDNIKINTKKVKNETKIDKENEKMDEFVDSIRTLEKKAKTEKIIITNELSEKIQSVIKIVYREKPLYENLFVVVKLDNEICEFPIEEAVVKFPIQIIRYFNEKSIYN